MFNGRKVVVWGAGVSLECSMEMIHIVDYIVDRNESLWGTEFCGKIVKNPQELLNEDGKVTILITSRKYESVIRKDIISLNINADIEVIYDYISARSFAQYGEDAVIEKLLKKAGIKKIKYIDIGLPSPVFGSNTYAFYLGGSNGVCVEPNPDVTDILKQKRTRDIIVNKGIGAISDIGSKLKYYRFSGEGNSGLNTFDQKCYKERLKSGFKVKDIIDIDMISLNELIEQNMTGAPDYISLDTEGYEYRILKDFDFKKYCVKIFCVEKGDNRVNELLKSNGYYVAAETPSNSIYINDYIYNRVFGWEQFAQK